MRAPASPSMTATEREARARAAGRCAQSTSDAAMREQWLRTAARWRRLADIARAQEALDVQIIKTRALVRRSD